MTVDQLWEFLERNSVCAEYGGKLLVSMNDASVILVLKVLHLDVTPESLDDAHAAFFLDTEDVAKFGRDFVLFWKMFEKEDDAYACGSISHTLDSETIKYRILWTSLTRPLYACHFWKNIGRNGSFTSTMFPSE